MPRAYSPASDKKAVTHTLTKRVIRKVTVNQKAAFDMKYTNNLETTRIADC